MQWQAIIFLQTVVHKIFYYTFIEILVIPTEFFPAELSGLIVELGLQKCFDQVVGLVKIQYCRLSRSLFELV
jgi:hypothetical protein